MDGHLGHGKIGWIGEVGLSWARAVSYLIPTPPPRTSSHVRGSLLIDTTVSSLVWMCRSDSVLFSSGSADLYKGPNYFGSPFGNPLFRPTLLGSHWSGCMGLLFSPASLTINKIMFGSVLFSLSLVLAELTTRQAETLTLLPKHDHTYVQSLWRFSVYYLLPSQFLPRVTFLCLS